MTLKESILLSLEEINKPSTYLDIYNYIIEKKYWFRNFNWRFKNSN